MLNHEVQVSGSMLQIRTIFENWINAFEFLFIHEYVLHLILSYYLYVWVS